MTSGPRFYIISPLFSCKLRRSPVKNQLILTLTTVSGSRQLSLSRVARYLLAVWVLMLLGSFFISNTLLVQTSDELNSLSADHQQLAELYTDVIDSRASVRTELDQLSDNLGELEQERNALQRLSNDWAQPVRQLEVMMGLEPVEPVTVVRIQELQQRASERLFMLHGIPNGSPLEEVTLTDRFGQRRHPVTGKKSHHDGLDFRAASGTPIYATADGAVEYSGFHKSSGYGNLIIINHNFGFKSYYAHLKKTVARSGQLLEKGQLIGYSGNTGISTGPHLHYEVRYLFKPLNPILFLNWSMDNYESVFKSDSFTSKTLQTVRVLGQDWGMGADM
ncbi:MAG: murein DD-endopeptidase MepM/ murein hydrolase activator NlpD [Motiliproteus sp.]